MHNYLVPNRPYSLSGLHGRYLSNNQKFFSANRYPLSHYILVQIQAIIFTRPRKFASESFPAHDSITPYLNPTIPGFPSFAEFRCRFSARYLHVSLREPVGLDDEPAGLNTSLAQMGGSLCIPSVFLTASVVTDNCVKILGCETNTPQRRPIPLRKLRLVNSFPHIAETFLLPIATIAKSPLSGGDPFLTLCIHPQYV